MESILERVDVIGCVTADAVPGSIENTSFLVTGSLTLETCGDPV